MARKKEKQPFILDELFEACNSVYNAIISPRESGKAYAMKKHVEKKRKKGG